MSHSAPSWGIGNASQSTYRVTDLGELAVRLGSPVSHDRRGDVLTYDDFEYGIGKWFNTPGSLGSSWASSNARSRNKQYSGLLQTAGGLGTYEWLYFTWPYPANAKIGNEISISIGSPDLIVDIGFDAYNPPSQRFGAVRYNNTSKTLSYYKSDTTWGLLESSFSLSPNYPMFNVFKVVADLDKGEYKRIIVNNREWDMTGIPLYIAPTVVPGFFRSFLRLTNTTIASSYIYLDDLVLTQNEP